jgi:hypothetical protein
MNPDQLAKDLLKSLDIIEKEMSTIKSIIAILNQQYFYNITTDKQKY